MDPGKIEKQEETNAEIENQVINVAMAGAADDAALYLAFRIATGRVFGARCRVRLWLLDRDDALAPLLALGTELRLCAPRQLVECIVTTEYDKALPTAHVVIALYSNSYEDYRTLGSALDAFAQKDVFVCVGGRPVNTNCFVLAECAPTIDVANITGVACLVDSIACRLVAERLETSATRIHGAVTWGAVDGSCYPDMTHATVVLPDTVDRCYGVYEACQDDQWFKTDFIERVRKMAARPLPLARAVAVEHHLEAAWCGSERGCCMSMVVASRGQHGVPPGLFFSFPVYCGNRAWRLAPVPITEVFHRIKIDEAVRELQIEKEKALMFLKGDAGISEAADGETSEAATNGEQPSSFIRESSYFSIGSSTEYDFTESVLHLID